MGFRSSQFYTPGTNPPGDRYFSDADNNEFAYPSRVVRGTRLDSSGNLVADSDTLQSGYIRNLEYGDTGAAVRKCKFQFNPSKLRQVVAANESMLNVLQQDPYQWAQPFGGDISFEFELLFDRSYELNNSPDSPESDIADPDATSLWDKYGPGQVGVLHDISVLSSVIGLGISSSQEQYLKDLLTARVTSETANRALEFTDLGLQPADVAEEALDKNLDNYVSGAIDGISLNAGNSAFLIPLPVRAVFSSLYVVEGLVRNVDIQFVKFTTKMVPMIASVTVSMEAKYVGFSKPKTFFTEALTSDVVEPVVATTQQIAKANETLELIIQQTPTMHVTTRSDKTKNVLSPRLQPNGGTAAPFTSDDQGGLTGDYDAFDEGRYTEWAIPSPHVGANPNVAIRNLLTTDNSSVRIVTYVHILRVGQWFLDWLAIIDSSLVEYLAGFPVLSVPANSGINQNDASNYSKIQKAYRAAGGGKVNQDTAGNYSVTVYPWLSGAVLDNYVTDANGDVAPGPNSTDAEDWPDLWALWNETNSNGNAYFYNNVVETAVASGNSPNWARSKNAIPQISKFDTDKGGAWIFPTVTTLAEIYGGWGSNTNTLTSPKSVTDFDLSCNYTLVRPDPDYPPYKASDYGLNDQNLTENQVGTYSSDPLLKDAKTLDTGRETAIKWGSSLYETGEAHQVHHIVRVFGEIIIEEGPITYRGRGQTYRYLRHGQDYPTSSYTPNLGPGFVFDESRGLYEVINLDWKLDV